MKRWERASIRSHGIVLVDPTSICISDPRSSSRSLLEPVEIVFVEIEDQAGTVTLEIFDREMRRV